MIFQGITVGYLGGGKNTSATRTGFPAMCACDLKSVKMNVSFSLIRRQQRGQGLANGIVTCNWGLMLDHEDSLWMPVVLCLLNNDQLGASSRKLSAKLQLRFEMRFMQHQSTPQRAERFNNEALCPGCFSYLANKFARGSWILKIIAGLEPTRGSVTPIGKNGPFDRREFHRSLPTSLL